MPLGVLGLATDMSRFLTQVLPGLVPGGRAEDSLIVDLDRVPVIFCASGRAVSDFVVGHGKVFICFWVSKPSNRSGVLFAFSWNYVNVSGGRDLY